MYFQFIILLLFFSIGYSLEEDESQSSNEEGGGVVVETLNGKVEGFKIDLDDPAGEQFSSADIFLGIPYAQPPINELRLEVKICNNFSK